MNLHIHEKCDQLRISGADFLPGFIYISILTMDSKVFDVLPSLIWKNYIHRVLDQQEKETNSSPDISIDLLSSHISKLFTKQCKDLLVDKTISKPTEGEK